MNPCKHAVALPQHADIFRCAIEAAHQPSLRYCLAYCAKREGGPARPPERIPGDYDPKLHLHEGGCGCDPPLE